MGFWYKGVQFIRVPRHLGTKNKISQPHLTCEVQLVSA